MKMNRRPLAALLWLLISPASWAHDPGLSTAAVKLAPDHIEVVITLALKDATSLAASDANDPASFGASVAANLKKVVSEGFCLELDGRPAKIATGYSRDGNSTTSIELVVPSTKYSRLTVRSELLARLPFGHRQYLTVQMEEQKPFAEALLTAKANELSVPVSFALTSRPDQIASFATFLALGVKHILTGYDHLLFLFGLLLVTSRISATLRIITCFTLAHSITLALATLSPVPAPARMVEPLIAASIVYVGIENLLRGTDPKGRSLVTFAFGLIHGCGFASALRELGIGSASGGIIVPLMSFNLGVELGQLAMATLVFPLIWRLRTQPAFVARVVPFGSAVVVLLGSFWLVQRICS